ncbi:hypothetical protein Dsin_021207 [Dipteronia sinensis]|uniref:Uncharacterized protein n=1 Tax=Dipteronia sinensis TaxID=43782 RepID=A0AAE0A041_9ROSI|nr:hypothetical protein Dsin_021207 [Dipteronia sinensis]
MLFLRDRITIVPANDLNDLIALNESMQSIRRKSPKFYALTRSIPKDAVAVCSQKSETVAPLRRISYRTARLQRGCDPKPTKPEAITKEAVAPFIVAVLSSSSGSRIAVPPHLEVSWSKWVKLLEGFEGIREKSSIRH